MAETTTVTFETAADETRGVEHALRAEKRAAAEFEGDDALRLSADLTDSVIAVLQRGGVVLCCHFFVDIFEAHGLRSLLTGQRSAGASLEGA
jgi:hypothetical protein